MDYLTLVNDNQREDSYVNATKWCKHFGKDLNEFKRLPSTKAYLKALEDKGYGLKGENPGSTLLEVTRGGRHQGTWVHPMIAIALAKWLSPDFHVFVNETFQRYLENDITLADEILQRATKEQAQWLMERAEGKVARSEFAAEVAKRAGNVALGIALNTDAAYKGLFGMTAKELKGALECKNPRDGMSKVELAAVRLTELLAVEDMQETDAKGLKKTTACSEAAGKKVARVFE